MLFYKIIICVSISVIWFSIGASKYANYDENYALIFFAVFISVITCILIGLFVYFKREIVKSSTNLTVLFVASSSPVSLYLFFYSYEDVFGQFLNFPS